MADNGFLHNGSHTSYVFFKCFLTCQVIPSPDVCSVRTTVHRIMIQYYSALFSGISNTEKITNKLFLWLDPIGKQ